MDDFCFVHAADLHLGARPWLRSEPQSRAFRERLRLAGGLALHALVDLCLEQRARLLVCAGDIIDGWCRDYGVVLRLVEELLRLKGAGCEVVFLLGNHDVRSRLLRTLPLPGFARVLGLGGPETLVLEEIGAALHGFSAPELSSPTDVAALYPAPVPGLFNIGLLHTSAEGTRGHIDYAPCSRRTLRRHGYDYWALGHVHAREVIAKEPWIVFPGNLQGRNPRETGAKGASLVCVSGGKVTSVEARALAALRYETVLVDIAQVDHFDDVLATARRALAAARSNARGCPLVVELTLSGVTGVAAALSVPLAERQAALEQVARELGDETLWLDEAWLDAGPLAGTWPLARAA